MKYSTGMINDTKFATATHIMCVLAFVQDKVSATFVGEQISINPVVVRRLLSLLNKAQLVTSSFGPKGGSKLSRAAKEISLLDIYKAIYATSSTKELNVLPKSVCSEGERIDRVLDEIYSKANEAMEGVLQTTSLQEILDSAKN